MFNLSEISHLREIHVKTKYIEEIKKDLESPCVHRIIPVKVIADDSLSDKYKILDERFENDRFTTWWDADNPPSWAIGLGIVKAQPYIEIKTNPRYSIMRPKWQY